MKLPTVPGPRDVAHLLGRGTDGVEMLLAAVPRLMGLLDDAGALLARADTLVSRVDALLERIEHTRGSADAVVRRTDDTVARAESALLDTAELAGRARTLLDANEPSLVKLQPILERLAETTHPVEVDALVTLVDTLPGLALRLERDVIPVLEGMRSVSPDLHDLLEMSRELNELFAALPGLGRVKRRIDQDQEARGRG